MIIQAWWKRFGQNYYLCCILLIKAILWPMPKPCYQYIYILCNYVFNKVLGRTTKTSVFDLKLILHYNYIIPSRFTTHFKYSKAFYSFYDGFLPNEFLVYILNYDIHKDTKRIQWNQNVEKKFFNVMCVTPKDFFLLYIFCFHSNSLSTFYYYLSSSKGENNVPRRRDHNIK